MNERKAIDESDLRMLEAKEIVQKFSDYVNNMGASPDAFAEHVMREHRTLQQSMFRVMLACIKRWSQEERFDLRNEDTVNTCKCLQQLMDADDRLGYVRFV